MKWRKKIPRCTTFDTNKLICSCRWPVWLSEEELKERPKIMLTQDELQTMIDRDIDGKIMDEACLCMGVSKTVYAGIHSSARRKITESLISWAVLTIECNK
jgi:predicted DNA-binding protein (UPF0251 family)